MTLQPNGFWGVKGEQDKATRIISNYPVLSSMSWGLEMKVQLANIEHFTSPVDVSP